MSTIETYYCNQNTDLLDIVPDLQAYDQKRLVTNWQIHDNTSSPKIYRADSVGYVSKLFREGKDLGAAQASLGAVDTEDEWYYEADTVYIALSSSNEPNDDSYEVGPDWEALKLKVVKEQAERIRSYIGRPILSRKGVRTESAAGREYDFIIIEANATLACSYLVRAHNPELGLELEQRIINTETGQGLLDLLKRGEYKLWNEVERQYQVREVSINGSTTSNIVDVRGDATVNWDAIKIVVSAGGTLTQGSENTAITYSTYIKNDNGIKNSITVENEPISLGWDNVGHGMYVRWSAGVVTTNDEWELEVNGAIPENALIKNVKLYR